MRCQHTDTQPFLPPRTILKRFLIFLPSTSFSCKPLHNFYYTSCPLHTSNICHETCILLYRLQTPLAVINTLHQVLPLQAVTSFIYSDSYVYCTLHVCSSATFYWLETNFFCHYSPVILHNLSLFWHIFALSTLIKSPKL